MAFIHRKIIVKEEQYKERLQRLQHLYPHIDIQYEEANGVYKIKYEHNTILWQEDIEINEMAADDEKFVFVELRFNDLEELEYFWKDVLRK